MFERILVPLDGSLLAEKALVVAAQIAQASGGRVILFHAVDAYGPYWVPTSNFSDTSGARSYLNRLVHADVLADVETEIALPSGNVVQTILSYAQSHADMIVMSSHNYTGINHFMRVSVADEVIRHAPVPVLVLRHQEHTGPLTLADNLSPLRAIIALDGSVLAESTLKPVAYLTALLSAPTRGILHLLRIVGYPHRLGLSHKAADELQEQAVQEATDYLAATLDYLQKGLAAQLNLTCTSSIVVGGDVARDIIQTSESCRLEGKYKRLIAMSTRAHSGLPRLPRGSVTERVLHGTQLPVFIV